MNDKNNSFLFWISSFLNSGSRYLFGKMVHYLNLMLFYILVRSLLIKIILFTLGKREKRKIEGIKTFFM